MQATPKEMTIGKAPRVDRCAVQCLEAEMVIFIECLGKLLSMSFLTSVLTLEWTSLCVLQVPMCKWNRDGYQCSHNRGISFLSGIGKV